MSELLLCVQREVDSGATEGTDKSQQKPLFNNASPLSLALCLSPWSF